MIVLHMAWLKEKHNGAKPFLFVWAECSVRWQNFREQQTVAPGKRITIHPFAARSSQLWEAMLGLVGNDWHRLCQAGETVVFLPSQELFPCPSPQVGAALPESDLTLAPWRIPGYLLTPTEAAQFFQLLADRFPNHHGEVVIANDSAYWLKAFDFAQSLCRSGQFVPAIAKGSYSTQNWYRPVWQPYLAAAAEPMAAFIKAMPDAACHAIPYMNNVPTTIRPDKRQSFLSFMQAMVHAIICRHVPISSSQSRLAGEESFSLWLDYLLSGLQAGLPLASAEAEQLFQLLEQWQISADSAGDSIVGSYHCCLMLADPKNADEPWNLYYFIYPGDDPSLLLPAEEIWSGAGENFAYLQYRLPHLQHRLLSDLGYAARIFPPIASSLTEPCPAGCTLTVAEAYEFLGKAAGNLQKAGIRVIVPNWWGKEAAPFKVKLEVEDLPLGRSFVGVDALASYDVSIAIGEQPISRSELEQIAALKTPLVYIAGRWREVSPQQARAALAFFDKQGSEISFGGILKWSAAGEWDSEDEREENVIMSQVVPSARMAEIIHCLTTGTVPPVEAPSDFKGTLRHYQLHGLAWLEFLTRFGLGACLADDMGLGKTIQIIAYIQRLKQQEPAACCLIICPTSVLYNWQREIAKFAPEMRILVHYGPERLSGDRFAEHVLTKDVVLTTYGLANRDCDELSRSPWRCIIVDEAQNLKNPQAQQTVAVSKIPAVSKIALTGTPVENRLSELWSIMNWLNSGYLGTIDQFKQQYAVPIERGQNVARQQRLQQVIKPFILRRLKTDKTIAPDLPDKQESKVYCQLTREQATLYQAVLDVMLPQIAAADPITRKALIGATLTKLKQICNHPAHFLKDGSALAGRSNKLTRLTEMLAELQDEGRRALVFTQYTQMGVLIQQHLRDVFGWSPLFFHGSLSRTERDKVITSFQSDEQSPPVLILSLKAGGVGLNLTKADTVFHYDRWWNPAVENQATDRAFRIGQTNNVQVYKFITAATLEEKIDDMIESKKSLAENIIGVSETWLGDLSASELKSVLELHAAGLEE